MYSGIDDPLSILLFCGEGAMWEHEISSPRKKNVVNPVFSACCLKYSSLR